MTYFPVSLETAICFIAATLSILLAALVALRDRRSLANRSFIACLVLLALVEFIRGWSFDAGTLQEALFWQRTRIMISSLLPGTCLFFSLTFARVQFRQSLARWKFVVAGLYAAPVLTIALFSDSVFEEFSRQPQFSDRLLPLGIAGKFYYCLFLIAATLILANLERTLRSSTGRIRWQIKFVVLGMGGICAVWIYIASQALIYSVLDVSLGLLNPAVLLAADVLFLWGLVRSRFLHVDVYLSRTTIQYSLTAVLVSVYLVVVGILAYLVRFYHSSRLLPLDAFVVLLALTGLAILVLSDRLQERLKRFVTRHFKRPVHDYRKVWMDLTEQTNSLVDLHELCTASARIISQTLNVLSVNVWLCDEARERLTLAGSTVFTRSQAESLERGGAPVAELLRIMDRSAEPLDLKVKPSEWAEDIMSAQPDYYREFRMRFAVPLQSGRQLVGLITLNDDRVGKAPLSAEDQDLLHAYGTQLAARVIQFRLLDRLRHAQEVEVFQNAAAFFVHDMKNLASRLSLTMQNLPAHFENPVFRADAFKLIGESLNKIDSTCERLSSLKQNVELKTREIDLNALVAGTLDGLAPAINCPLERDLKPLPPIVADYEQLQKVVTNLVLNAHEAVNHQGSIRVATEAADRHLVLSVADTGCGMSGQFIEQMLFRPFRSTKKRGMGIGLFHCRMIVEAHQGRIEVASREGAGSTFRVILPLAG